MIITFCCCILFSFATMAQGQPAPKAEAFFKAAISTINGQHLQWIQSSANEANQLQWGPATIISKSNRYEIQGNLNTMDIEALAVLVMMQASKSAQEDLKAIMAGVKSINEQKAKQREMLSRMQKQQDITGIPADRFNFLLSRSELIQKRQNPELLHFQTFANKLRHKKKTKIKKKREHFKKNNELVIRLAFSDVGSFFQNGCDKIDYA